MTLIEHALGEGASAEAIVFGQPVDPFAAPKTCGHRSFGVDSLGAIVNDERDNWHGARSGSVCAAWSAGFLALSLLTSGVPKTAKSTGSFLW